MRVRLTADVAGATRQWRGLLVRLDASLDPRTRTTFGTVEHSVIALKPENLTAVAAVLPGVDDAEDGPTTFTPDPEDADLREASWQNLINSLGLRHLRGIHWSKYEEEIFIVYLIILSTH